LGDARVERRDGVAIDRDLGRVSGARKYDFEVVAPGSAFQFVLELDSPEPWQEGLVAIGLDLLDQGVARLGGAKSRGLGVVKFEELAVRTLTKELLVAGEAPMVSGYGDWRKSVLVSWTDKVGQMKGRR
jgi:CRISPR/Cas system CSM-associated protein Csm3 (group 7 of RAMP superfamily)